MAQEIPHFIEKLTTAEGLSSNRINDMVQDDNGFLWVATSDGLNRFDGTEVTQYYYHNNINSLPHNYVYCLKKLPGNWLAIGTQAGLSFYDGNSGTFHNFYYTGGNGLDEYNNAIIELETDAAGNLWAASPNCVYVFDTRRALKKVFTSPFTEADARKKRLRFAEKIVPLPAGPVLLCLYDGWYISPANAGSMTKLCASSFKMQFGFLKDSAREPPARKNEQYFPASSIFKVFERYFIFIEPRIDSLFLLDENGRRLCRCFFPYNKFPYVSWSQRVAVLDSGRILFLFHNKGLAVIPVSWQNNRPELHALSPLLFESSEYNNGLADRQGNWWLATTEKGVEKISPHKQSFKGGVLTDSSTGKPFSGELVSLNRYRNSLWLSTYGDGFFNVDLLSGWQQQYHLQHTSDDTWANFIWNTRQVSADTLWVGTQAGMFWYCISSRRHGRLPAYPGKPAALDSVPITIQFTDSHGLTWMGLGKGRGLCCFDGARRSFTYFRGSLPGSYPLRYPVCMTEDGKGNCWFTNDASTVLVYWNRGTGRFQCIALPAAQRKLLSNLYGICCEGDSILWLGTIASGLLKFSVLKNTLTIYGHDRGLVNSRITSIYEDSTRRLWLVTEGGLSCFDPVTETFANYTENDGLPLRTPTAFFYYDTAGKQLYGGGHGAYFYFNPQRMNTGRAPQKTTITSMEVNGRSFMPGADGPLAFSEQQNDITIHYAAVDLASGPETNYAYKLIGEDTGWVMAGHQRQINFSHLSPGRYTFMVRSGNSSGAWSKASASISFSISPPFTQTIWFYLLILLGMGAVFYLLYRFRLRQILRTEQIRAEISRNLHDEVGSTLTNISLGSLLAQKQLQGEGPVNKLLERIYQDSQTVSQTMREIVWSINPKIDTLGEALPRMLQYASELLEAKNIELEAEIAPEIEQIKLTMQRRRDLYLIFKEAVTNLARHSNAGRAAIRFHLSANILTMTVADNGAGFNGSTSFTGNGLKNMKERAENHQWQLTIQSHPGEGTTLILKAVIA